MRRRRKQVNRIAFIIKETNNKVDALEAGGSTSYKCTSNDEEKKEKKKKTCESTKSRQQYESEI